MRIYDISKELFTAEVYPGDPQPEQKRVFQIGQGDVCNLSVLTMGSHNGTHMDAPYHFVESGRTIEKISLEQIVGMCNVLEVQGSVGREYLEKCIPKGCVRLLLKGDFCLEVDGARYLAEQGLRLYGIENLTVGEGEKGIRIHQILLGADMVILESLVLEEVPEGRYFLCAAPLKMAGLDGSPCRPLLIEESFFRG